MTTNSTELHITAAAKAFDLAEVDTTTLTDHDFTRHIVTVNEAFTEHKSALEALSKAYGASLTERIARRLADIRPHAVWLGISVRMKYHVDAQGNRDAHCEGHDPVMLPTSVLTSDRETLEPLDPMDPIHYWLECLVEVMDPEASLLRLPDRQWIIAANDDDGVEIPLV